MKLNLKLEFREGRSSYQDRDGASGGGRRRFHNSDGLGRPQPERTIPKSAKFPRKEVMKIKIDGFIGSLIVTTSSSSGIFKKTGDSGINNKSLHKRKRRPIKFILFFPCGKRDEK